MYVYLPSLSIQLLLLSFIRPTHSFLLRTSGERHEERTRDGAAARKGRMRDGSAARGAAAAPPWQREELDQAEQLCHGEGRPGGTAFAWPGAEHDEANLLSAASERAIRLSLQLTAPDRMQVSPVFQGVGNDASSLFFLEKGIYYILASASTVFYYRHQHYIPMREQLPQTHTKTALTCQDPHAHRSIHL
jgi:hypothetical protein